MEDEDMPEGGDYRPPELPWPAAGQQPYGNAPARRWPARYGVPLVLTATGTEGNLTATAIQDPGSLP